MASSYKLGLGRFLTPHVSYWGGDTAHTLLGVGTPHNIERKSLAVGGGGPDQKIMPLCGSILQAETCQILRMRIQYGAEGGNKSSVVSELVDEAER